MASVMLREGLVNVPQAGVKADCRFQCLHGGLLVAQGLLAIGQQQPIPGVSPQLGQPPYGGHGFRGPPGPRISL